jgi:RNA methyltransferase, TrmH family
VAATRSVTKGKPPNRRRAERNLSRLAYRHQRVQRLRRLLARRSVRQAERCLVVEGAKVIGVALDAGARVESLYVDSDLVRPDDGTDGVVNAAVSRGARVFELAPGVLARVADTVSPQPLLAVVGTPELPLEALAGQQPTMVVVCVDVRDPGNAGAVVRAAEAAGAGGIISCMGSADLSNPKAVRASAGSVFQVPVVAGGAPQEVLEELGRWGLQRLGTDAHGGCDYSTVDLTRPVAVVLGNEARGLPSALAECLDERVTIPMDGRAESLNVSMTAAVICFEAARQRRAGAGAADPASGGQRR